MNVTINNVSKYYKDQFLFKIDNLEFKQNYTYCIRGRNGTGKTTLLKIIANLILANSGTILYDGERVQSKVMNSMTYISMKPYLFDTTVYNNIAYPLKVRKNKLKNSHQLIDDYLDYFELTHLKDRHAKTCSSGEQMKIAIIRGIIFQPALLLLDEPTTNLDSETIEKLKRLLLKLKKTTTIIFISHHGDFINEISDVQFIIREQRLELRDSDV